MKMLTIENCPHGVFAVSLDDGDKSRGVRLSPQKCCGRWDRVKAWPMTAANLRAIAEELEQAAEDIDSI